MMKILVLLLLLPLWLYSQTSPHLRLPMRNDCSLVFILRFFDGTTATDAKPFAIQNEQNAWSIDFNGGLWQCTVDAIEIKGDYLDITCRVRLQTGEAKQTAVCLEAVFHKWAAENYVLLPGAAYNGNRFNSLPMPYPPLMDDPKFFGPNLPLTISNVPRLNIDAGLSKIEQTTGDPATPAMGFFSQKQKRMTWILTEQQTRFGNSGLTVTETEARNQCKFTITAPAVREKRQIMVNQVSSDDRAPDWSAGDELTLRARLYFDRADKVQDLFDRFVEVRKDFSGPTKLSHQLPFDAALQIQQKKYNEQNWDENRGYYSVGMRENMAQDWQLGWVGGLMATLPLLAKGDSSSFARAYQNIETILSKTRAPSGFFYGIGDGATWYGDGFTAPHPHNMHMVRKSADALYFLAKQFLLLEAKNPEWHCPDDWRRALVDLADAFVALWQRHGQFGQFVDVETGALLVWGSSAGAMAPGGLALAAYYLKDDKYLKTAEKAAQFYYARDVKNGLTTGGPGEILQCPDSESGFALLESFVTLYEITLKGKYRDMAKEMARQCASWTVSYDYTFPDSSLFGKLDMKTTGAVIANVQNKHGAPGICTLSGNSLLRLYRATADTFYLDLLRDISHNITQYLSRADRPVGEMPPGWMNERVNLSDWEGAQQVGGIFNGSTWAEVACMLTATEIPSIYVQQDSWEVWAFDHINVSVLDKGRRRIKLLVENPTEFAATFSILVEDKKDLKNKLSPVYFKDFFHFTLAPGESKRIAISFKNIRLNDQPEELPLPLYRENRLPQKTSGYIAPTFFWPPDERTDNGAFIFDLHTNTSTLYKPSPANFRLGTTFTAGAFAFIYANEHLGFFPLPYVAYGPEARLLKYFYLYPHIGSLGFPVTLINNYWLFLTYGGLEMGLRIPVRPDGTLVINYGAKVFPMWFRDDWDETMPSITNISIGWEF